MNEYWNVKRNCYTVNAIRFTNEKDPHGCSIIWEDKENAWNDIEERVEEFMSTESEHCYAEKVQDGYIIKSKHSKEVIVAYKIFEAQELE